MLSECVMNKKKIFYFMAYDILDSTRQWPLCLFNKYYFLCDKHCHEKIQLSHSPCNYLIIILVNKYKNLLAQNYV